MIEEINGKVIIKEKVILNIKNFTLKTRNPKNLEKCNTVKKVTPLDKMILIRRKKDISDKYTKLNLLTETKNFSIISSRNEEIVTDNIDSLKLLNDCLGIPYKKSLSIPKKQLVRDKNDNNKEELVKKISNDLVKKNLRCFLSNDEIVSHTFKNHKLTNEYTGTSEKMSPLKDIKFKLKTNIKHLNTVTNFSGVEDKNNLHLITKKIILKDKLYTDSSFNNNYIYTRDILPKINKFNALEVKSNCKKRFEKYFDRRSSIKKFEESDKILKENLSIFN